MQMGEMGGMETWMERRDMDRVVHIDGVVVV